MRADGDVRHRSGEIALRRFDPLRNLLLQRQDRVGDVHVGEEAAVVAAAGIDELVVDVGELGALDGEARAPQHPGLDAGVGDVVVLHPGGALHLDQPAGAAAALQDVGAHEHVGPAQRRLEQRDVAGGGERFLGLPHRGIEVGDVRDQAAFGKQPLRGRPDHVPLRHPVQDGLALLCEFAPIGLQPQALGALLVRDQAGLRKSHVRAPDSRA